MLNKTKLTFLPENQLTDVVSDFVSKEDNTLISKYLTDSIEETRRLIDDTLQIDIDDDAKLAASILKAKEHRFPIDLIFRFKLLSR